MSFTNIITVTLNPSLDRTVTTRYLNVGYHNPVTDTTRLDPAGAGVSISRALHKLGSPTEAIVLLHNDTTGAAYTTLLQEKGVPHTILRTPGTTRSDTIIQDIATKQETRLVEACAPLTETALRKVADKLQARLTMANGGDQAVIFAGSLPTGSPEESLARLIEVAQAAGAETAVAVETDQIQPAIRAQPDLLVLTQLQAEVWFNFPVRSLTEVVFCARKLRESGSRKVLIEMADAGMAFLSAPTEEWLLDLPDLQEGTRSGVREAFLAGYLTGRQRQRPLSESLNLGGAAAAFTAQEVGQKFGSAENVESFLDDVQLARFSPSSDPQPTEE